MTSTGHRPWHLRTAMRSSDLDSQPWLLRVAAGLVREFQRLDPFDRAMTLAAQAFTSIFPLVIVTLSVLQRPDSPWLGDELARSLALPPSTKSLLVDTGPDDTSQAASLGALSLVIVLLSATSLSRALTRMYAKAWSVRAPGWTSGGWRWVAAILAITACTGVLRIAQGAAEGHGTALVLSALLLTFLVNSTLWTWVPWVLLAGQLSARRLALSGILMGASSVAMFYASRLYMPRALGHAEKTYGELGVAFVFIGWLFGVSLVLIVSTVVGVVLSANAGRWSKAGPGSPQSPMAGQPAPPASVPRGSSSPVPGSPPPPSFIQDE